MRRSTGSAFEREVYTAVESAVASGGLGFDPTCCRVRHHPAYHSRDREKDVTFDVSIELILRGATAPSIVWIWECKDYSKAVPVDDVEEFHSKLQQVGADRTKGTIITRVGFQEAAFTFAKAKGIGLARMMAHSQIDWVIYRAPPTLKVANRDAIRIALTDPDFVSQNEHFYAVTEKFSSSRNLNLQRYLRLQFREWGFSEGDTATPDR